MSSNIMKCLQDNNKIFILEEKLNKGMDYFVECLKKTKKFEECRQNLIIDYDNYELVLQFLFFK